MSFQKKFWLNIPDPNNLPETPEGQNELAIFDADNMNRIEEGIANSYKETRPITAGGTGATTVEDVLKNLGLSDAAKIAIGSYVGTGAYGQSNPTVINCPDFKPMMMIIGTSTEGNYLGSTIMVRGLWQPIRFNTYSGMGEMIFAFENNSISFYIKSGDSPAYAQYNTEGNTYSYLIIGE